LALTTWGGVKNNLPGFLGNHPAERDGDFEIADVFLTHPSA
jgi:hypothetical protein